MVFDMTRTKRVSRSICPSVIVALFFAFLHPTWAAEGEVVGGNDKDPAVVTDDRTSKPDGVKELVKKQEEKTITDPVYGRWWFWVVAIGAAGALATLAVLPLQKQAAACPSNYQLGCIGDGR